MENSEIVSKFQNVGIDDVPESGVSARSIILEVLDAFPGKWFPKSAFVDALKEVPGVAHSSPAIYAALKKLAKNSEIEVSKGGKKNYYRRSA